MLLSIIPFLPRKESKKEATLSSSDHKGERDQRKANQDQNRDIGDEIGHDQQGKTCKQRHHGFLFFAIGEKGQAEGPEQHTPE